MIGDLIREWANSGTKVDPGNTEIDNGWVFRERPPAEWFNYIWAQWDRRINELLGTMQNALASMPPAIDSSNTGRKNPLGQYADWSQPWTAQNSAEISATDYINEVAVGWDSENEIPLAFFARTDSITGTQTTIELSVLECWQYGDDLANSISTRTITPGFTVDNTVQGEKLPMICADGFLYVAVTDKTGSVNNGKYLQKYSIANWTGLPVSSTLWISSANDTGDYSSLCEADDNTLALVQIDGSGNQIVHFADKDTTPGTPAASVASRTNLRKALVSDGTYLYYSSEPSGGGQYDIYRMSISSKTATAVNWTASFVVEDLRCIGGGVVIGMLVSETAASVDPRIFVGYDNAGTWTLRSSNATIGQANATGNLASIGYDGVSVYFPFKKSPSATSSGAAYTKIPADRVDADEFMVGTQFTNLSYDAFPSKYSRTAPGFAGGYSGYSLSSFYDGKDVWFVTHRSASNIYRVVAPSVRERAR